MSNVTLRIIFIARLVSKQPIRRNFSLICFVLLLFHVSVCRNRMPQPCMQWGKSVAALLDDLCDKNDTYIWNHLYFLLNRDTEFDFCARTEAICIYRLKFNITIHKMQFDDNSNYSFTLFTKYHTENNTNNNKFHLIARTISSELATFHRNWWILVSKFFSFTINW